MRERWRVGHAREKLQISIHNALAWLKCRVLGYTVNHACEDTIQKRELQFIRFLNPEYHHHCLTVVFMSYVFELFPNLRWIEILWCVFPRIEVFRKCCAWTGVRDNDKKLKKRQLSLLFFPLFFEKREEEQAGGRKSQPFLSELLTSLTSSQRILVWRAVLSTISSLTGMLHFSIW
jgi:hypothetical protein